MSTVKKLQNEISTIEKEGIKKIEYNKFYVIAVEVIEGDVKDGDVKKWVKFFLKQKSHQPLSIYTFETDIYLIFSCLDGEHKMHYLDGEYHRLISDYVSKMNNIIKGPSSICCHIVEFFTRTQVFAYFACKVFENSQRKMIKVTDGDVKSDYTLQESLDIIEKSGIIWDDIPKVERYGSFYRLRRNKGRIVTVSLSESFDARDSKKYIKFIFD